MTTAAVHKLHVNQEIVEMLLVYNEICSDIKIKEQFIFSACISCVIMQKSPLHTYLRYKRA